MNLLKICLIAPSSPLASSETSKDCSCYDIQQNMFIDWMSYIAYLTPLWNNINTTKYIMEIILKEILNALGYLLISGIVYTIWKMAFDDTIKSNYKTVLLKGLVFCVGIALFASISLGNPTCLQISDPAYGGCDEYADDGYVPTSDQKVANFAYYMTFLYVPVMLGVYKSKKNSILGVKK